MAGLPGYPCPVCRRAGGAITVNIENQPLQQICSVECARIYMSGKELKQNEREAISAGGRIAGAYLEQIGQFDLRNLTPDQWAEFCGKMFQGTCEEMRRQANDSIPF